MSLIKTYNAEARIIEEMHKDNCTYRDTQINLATIRSTMFPFIATIGSIGQIILLYFGGQQIINGSLTIGELVAFSTYLTLLAWPTAALSWIINIIQRGVASLKRINAILDTAPHPQFNTAPTHHLMRHQKIQVKNYPFATQAVKRLFIGCFFHHKPRPTLGYFWTNRIGKNNPG